MVTLHEQVVPFMKEKSQCDKSSMLKGEGVDIVEQYKYLGTHICSDLKWSQNISAQCKKCHLKCNLTNLYYGLNG